MSTEIYYVKSRTPIRRARYISHELLGNEIHVELYVNDEQGDETTEFKVFTYANGQEAKKEYDDIENWIDE